MNKFAWQQMSLIDRVRWLCYILPPLLVLVVIFYQLGIAQALETTFGHAVHYGVEVAFYSLTGPVVTCLMLVWVERKLEDQERLEPTIFRLVQESLNNTAKHAQATKVSVELQVDDRVIQLIVKDNGRGFAQSSKGSGLGLNQMASRAKANGGTFHIESQPGNGTTVVSRLPLSGVGNA